MVVEAIGRDRRAFVNKAHHAAESSAGNPGSTTRVTATDGPPSNSTLNVSTADRRANPRNRKFGQRAGAALHVQRGETNTDNRSGFYLG